jgi:serine/threonine protein kinase
MSFAVGETVGPYRILDQLGQGGMATVFKAYHAALDRYVALKVLHPAFLEDPNFQARFQREARLIAKLEHPNIVPVYDFSEHENRPFLVMKFIAGETLKARLNRGPLSADEVLRVVDSVGGALTYAHKRGILHRDIKPSNVLMADDGGIYLADFGLARIAQAGESTLSSDTIMGTPQYISPEQAMGKKDLDEGTDIYSFGVMIYEMVVGQVPFSGDTPFSVIHDHIYTPLPLPHSINPHVPGAVERVLLKALSKERADRYADVPALVNAFTQAWQEMAAKDQEVTLAASTRSLPPMSPTSFPPEFGESKPAEAGAESDIPTKVRKRSPWPFIAGGILLIICCLFVAIVANRNNRLNRNAQTATGLAGAVTQPSGPVEPVNPAIDDAFTRVEQNPDDPYAHLDLAIALGKVNRMQEAIGQLNRAADLAGDNMDFFINAGDRLAEINFWPGVALMDLRLVRLQMPDVPDESRNRLHQSVYFAFENPLAPQMVAFNEIGALDEPLNLVAQAQFALYVKNDLASARSVIDKLKNTKDGLPEIGLLEGQLAIQNDNPEQAKRLLAGLESDSSVPQWIRDEANSMLKNIP